MALKAVGAMAKTAAILGLDTAAGAYLARLLGARGYVVRGTGGIDLLARLGMAADVTQAEEVGDAIASASEIYDLRGDVASTASLLSLGGTARLFIAASANTAAAMTALKSEARFIAIGIVYPHESRLGPGTSPVARIITAIAAGTNPDPADLVTATDCGWTAEYVDAMWRMLQRPKAEDLDIATGRVLRGGKVARVAAMYFKYTAAVESPHSEDVASGITGDPEPSAAALGWRAVTWGEDLVTVLCEGFTER